MLESMRAVQNTWIGKAVMALIFLLIIVGLSFFGFADLFRSATGNWVASVGGVEISADAFRQAYQTNMQQVQQRLQRPLTNVQAQQLGLDQQVLSSLVTDALLDGQVKKLGLAISDAQIAKVITQDRTFAGQNGQFDHERFNTLLRNNGLTEQTFVRDQRGVYLRQEVVDGLAGTMTTPKAAADALHRLQAETRSIDMLTLPPTAVDNVPAPDDAVLQKYYDERKQQFQAPEYRKLVVLAVTPADVAKPDAVTQDDLQRAYDTAPESQFGAPERRTIQQIVFPTKNDAEAAALRIAAGTSFADIAAERKVTGTDLDLGTVTRGQIFDKAVADEAFSLPENGTSAPIQGTFGPVLVHVAAITPGNRKPLEAVAPELRKSLAEQPARTRTALRDIHDKIEDQRASGKSLTEAAQAVGLAVRTIDAVDAGGHDKAGAAVAVPDRDQVLRAAFASDVGVDNDVVQTRTGDQVWFEVAGVEAAHQRSFAEVKPDVEAAWRKDEIATRLAAKAEDILKALKAGSTLEQAAATVGNAPITHAGDVRRAGGTGVSAAVALGTFDTAVGAFGSAAGENGTRVIFKVIDSVVPPLDAEAPQAKQDDERYRAILSDDILTAYLTHVQGSVGVKVNRDVLRNAIGG